MITHSLQITGQVEESLFIRNASRRRFCGGEGRNHNRNKQTGDFLTTFDKDGRLVLHLDTLATCTRFTPKYEKISSQELASIEIYQLSSTHASERLQDNKSSASPIHTHTDTSPPPFGLLIRSTHPKHLLLFLLIIIITCTITNNKSGPWSIVFCCVFLDI